MKKTIILMTTILTIITLSGCTIDDLNTNTVSTPFETIDTDKDVILESNDESNLELIDEDSELTEDEINLYGSAGALNDEVFTLEEMLIYAIQDEYAARAEYDYIVTNFDITKPFSNIIKSEETHISLLVPLFETYGFTLPEDTSSEHLIPIENVQEAFDTGVLAEILNISMYNTFLETDDLPQDVYDVFVKLRDASENHLSAFQKNAS